MAVRLRAAALDLTPLRESRPFRRLLLGDAISVVGTRVTAVAVPIQVYAQTTGALYSALAAGALVGALFSGWFRRIHRHGIAVLVAIAAGARRFRAYDAREPEA